MSVFDFFRNFFGMRHHNGTIWYNDTQPGTNSFRIYDYDSHQESFRNPIWQSDEDDDDDDIANFRKHFGDSLHDFEKMCFEFQRDMSKNLFTFETTFLGFPDDKAIPLIAPENDLALPPLIAPENDENLRDGMLKFQPIDIFENKIDTDLDGRISVEEFSKMWNKGNIQNQNITKPSVSSSFHFSNRTKIKYGPDGSIEKKQVIKDNEGNEKTIISQEIGDKKYVVTTRKDKNGIETKSEDLVNMNESELKDFIKNWKPIKYNINGHNRFFNFPWKKFIGPNYDPKL